MLMRARFTDFEMQAACFPFISLIKTTMRQGWFLDTPEPRLLNYAVFFCTKFKSVGIKELF